LGLLNRIPAPRKYREYLKGRFERVASALRSLLVLLNAREYFVKLTVLAELRDMRNVVGKLKSGYRGGS